MMTPILDTVPDSPEAHYTNLHVRARNTIERTIGLLKAQFRCLLVHRVMHYSPEAAGSIVNACVILHNICNKPNICMEQVSDEELPQEVQLDPYVDDVERSASNNLALKEGVATRNALVQSRRVEGHWVLGLIEDVSEDLRLEVCPENIRSAEVLVPLIKNHVLEGTTIHTDYWQAYDCLAEHGEDLRLEVCPENIRSAEVLVPLIKNHVLEGTTIHTDYWQAYDCLAEHVYIHEKVNHSDPDSPFVAPDGTHT
ncbi:unnamed protein product [Colias eurytheme]|nr:unnamed protein product [Colias eurytheme]